MSLQPRIRPTFSFEVSDKEQWFQLLKEQLVVDDAPVTGALFRRHAVLQVPESSRHFWSPNLNIEIRTEDGKTSLYGRFSPQPNIWTGFMAIYGVLVLVGLVGAVIGMAQLAMSSVPWGFALMPAAFVMAAFVYGAVFIGQGLSAEQMYEMRSFVDDVEDMVPSKKAR